MLKKGVGRRFSLAQCCAVRPCALAYVERAIGFHSGVRGIAAATKPGGTDPPPGTAQDLRRDIDNVAEYRDQVLMQARGGHQRDETARRVQANAAKSPVPVDGRERGDGFGVGSQDVNGGSERAGDGCGGRFHDSDVSAYRLLEYAVARHSKPVYVTARQLSVHHEFEARAAQALASVIGDQHRMAEGHGPPGVGVHHDHVQEEHVAGLHLQRVVLVEHRRIDP